MKDVSPARLADSHLIPRIQMARVLGAVWIAGLLFGAAVWVGALGHLAIPAVGLWSLVLAVLALFALSAWLSNRRPRLGLGSLWTAVALVGLLLGLLLFRSSPETASAHAVVTGAVVAIGLSAALLGALLFRGRVFVPRFALVGAAVLGLGGALLWVWDLPAFTYLEAGCAALALCGYLLVRLDDVIVLRLKDGAPATALTLVVGPVTTLPAVFTALYRQD